MKGFRLSYNTKETHWGGTKPPHFLKYGTDTIRI